ncbi:MAG: hypothetical protein Q8L07_01615 [Sediminibacterium sp.]|nr:hypothetical protein [Sediminibacterium sp.]MDP1812104.1 hypothetical protein [Sediminibacterium sp.]
MKITAAFFFVILLSIESHSQSLDASISNIANDIAQKVSKKNKVKLALADFLNNEGKVDALTEYIRQELELKLINADNLQVMDRKHFRKLLEENHLQSQGLIDEYVAKSAVAFIKIDGLVLAEITYMGDQVKIKVTVTDIATSLMYAASSSELINDVAIKNLLEPEVKICSECGGKGTVQTQTKCTACSGNGSIVCSYCKGAGRGSGLSIGTECGICNGKGKLGCNICSGQGKIISYQTCPKCNGKVQIKSRSTTPGEIQVGRPGKVEICPECIGTGKLKHEGSCSNCLGTGKLVIKFNYVDCSYCAGTGNKTTFNICSKCKGTGKL